MTTHHIVSLLEFCKPKSVTNNRLFNTQIPVQLVQQSAVHVVDVYCDGSTFSNGSKHACGGIGIYWINGEYSDVSEPYTLGIPTNQKTELYAMLKTLQMIDQLIKTNPTIDYQFKIHTDSEYVINCLTKWVITWQNNNWCKADGKPVKNKQLLVQIVPYYFGPNHNKITLQHVSSHTGKQDQHSIGNDRADHLAVRASKMKHI